MLFLMPRAVFIELWLIVCVDTKLLTCGCILSQSTVNIKIMGLGLLVVTHSIPAQWDLVT